MNSFLGGQKLLPAHGQLTAMQGWKKLIKYGSLGDGSGEEPGSVVNSGLVPHSRLHMYKRRRLSRLLDRLAVHICNNNQYPPPPWLMPQSQSADSGKQAADVPLDLSVKPDSPPVAEPNSFDCGTCGQTFAAHDRLAKHVASRHRNHTSDTPRAYECDVCHRKFSRSDMLTRHSRLHSGVKPYSCSTCRQEFSRSDHLATHQRTHTGEKPYHCPSCPYAACRRDMITRHMKTHVKKQKPI